MTSILRVLTRLKNHRSFYRRWSIRGITGYILHVVLPFATPL